MKSYRIKNFTVSTLDASYLVYTDYPYAILRLKVYTVVSYRYYSTSKSDSQSSDPDKVIPVPIFTINNLNKEDCKKSYRTLLKGKGGIYSFINSVNGNQYIGSAKDLYLRLNEHLDNKKSNIVLQKAFVKYGLDQFKFCTTT